MATLPARSGEAENLSARVWSTARVGMALLSCCRRASISATSDGRKRNAGAPVLGGRPIAGAALSPTTVAVAVAVAVALGETGWCGSGKRKVEGEE